MQAIYPRARPFGVPPAEQAVRGFDGPAITYLWTWKIIAGLSEKVQGIVPMPDGLVRVQGISLR